MTDGSPLSSRQQWLGTASEVAEAFGALAALACREVCCADLDLAVFAPSRRATVEHLHRLLLGDPRAEVLLLVDDATWLDRDAPRLRLLQRQFPHALKLRCAPADDPVGIDRCALFDATHLIEVRRTRHGIAEQAVMQPGRAAVLRRTFERRWQAAAHDLPVVPLGL